MSATITSAESIASAPTDDPYVPSLWVPPNERPPTEAEEARAREHSLSVGNKTEIGYDCRTDWYDPDEVDEKTKQHYETLDRHNRDNHWEYREDVNISKDYDWQLKLTSAIGIASQLGLSDLHKQIVIDRLFEIDGRRFGERTEAVAFCLCAIVLNEDVEDRYDREKVYHPARDDANNDPEFVRVQNQLVDAFGTITKSRLHSIYAKLKQGQPPLKKDEETQRFITANTIVQRHPSFAPEGTLPQPAGEV